jgi:hypothetical protein
MRRLAPEQSQRSPEGVDTPGCLRARKSPPQQEAAARKSGGRGISGWMPMREMKMEEDALHGGEERDERDDAHLTAADGAQEREHLVDPGQELRPQHEAVASGSACGWTVIAA